MSSDDPREEELKQPSNLKKRFDQRLAEYEEKFHKVQETRFQDSTIPQDSVLRRINPDFQCADHFKDLVLCCEKSLDIILCKKEEKEYIHCANQRTGIM